MGEIFTVLLDMPSGFNGHVSFNKDGSYTIFINARLDFKSQQKVYMHEIEHILNDDFHKINVDAIERCAHEYR